MNFVDTDYDEMKPQKVLQDAHWGPEKKGGNYFFKDVVWAVEDEVPREQHDNDLVGFSQNCQGRF